MTGTIDGTGAMKANDLDPEELDPVAKIRYAEALIRAEHWCTEDDWLFWGNLADFLNDVAHTPDLTGQTPKDWRRFNRAQDMATGFIRMGAARNKEEKEAG